MPEQSTALLKGAAVRLTEEQRKANAKAAKAAWREKNKDYMRSYREANKERIALQKQQWYTDNRQEVSKRVTERYQEKRAEILSYQASYYAANRSAVLDRVSRWKRENPELVAVQRQRRRAMKSGCGGQLSKDIVPRLFSLQRGLCACCRSDLRVTGHHLDHQMPLALGGANTDENMQLLCPSCNSSKHAKHPVDFMQQRGYLL